MRHALVVLSFLTLIAPLGGCIVRSPGHRTYRSGGCPCVRWAHRRRCVERCRVYNNGYCVQAHRVCSHDRYCAARSCR